MAEEQGTSKSSEEKTPLRISFGITRRPVVNLVEAPTEIVSVAVDSDEESKLEEGERQRKRRRLTHFENGDTVDDDKKEKAVIPMVVENDWRVAKLLELEKEGKLTDEDKAKLAILTENQPFRTTTEVDQENAISVEETKTVAEDADYSAISIESFGLAILRGCGWKEGEGIGRNPQVVPLRLPDRRPKGLGLGATSAKPKVQDKNGKVVEEDVPKELKRDSLINITSGRYNGMYGKVESRDDDNNSLYVKLAIGGQQIKISLFAARAVSQKEYDKDSKCINKGDYDKEKARIDAKRESMQKSSSNRKDQKSSTKRDDYSDVEYVEDTRLWVRPDLVVRFIDKKYKKGKFFGCKMRVVDVASKKDIHLEDDTGVIHYNLEQRSMETVIPRMEGEKIMIVRGKYAGERAVMEEKDKQKGRIYARLLSSNKVEKLNFDDVSQFHPKNEDLYDD